METKTAQILMVLKALAWIAFIGYLIEAGSIMISFTVSYLNPVAAKDLYKGLDFYNLRQMDFWHYTQSISLLLALSLMKAWVWWLVIKTLSSINLANPFKMEVAHILEKIGYILFSIWITALLASAHTGWLMKRTGESFGSTDTMDEFLFMAGLVYIISQVFKRGVEIQSENELTV